MEIINKEENIVKDKCPSCGKDGAIIQTTDFKNARYTEVMCIEGCGHFSFLERFDER